MPISRTFRHCVYDETGLPGLQPIWFAEADPVSGTGVAHDMLEHFRTDPGPTEGECMALGAYLLLRIEHGGQREFPNRMSGVGQGVYEILRDIVNHKRRGPLELKTRALPGYTEQRVQRAIREVFDDLDKLVEEVYIPTDDEDLLKATLSQYRENMASWIREGYRRATKRYADVDLNALGTYLFDKVGVEVDRLLDAGHLWDNALVRVSVDAHTCSVAFKVQDPESSRWIDGEMFA